MITDLVMRAIKARNPKPRYTAGALAAPLLFLRRTLSDRLSDGLIMSSFK